MPTFCAYAVTLLVASRKFAGLINPGERMLLPGFQLLLTAMVPHWHDSQCAQKNASRLATFLLVLQATFLHGYAANVATRLEHTFQRLEPFARDRPLILIYESHFDFQGQRHPPRPLSWTLLPLHYPMLRLTYYAGLTRALALPIFQTGLFRSGLAPSHNDARSLSQLDSQTVLVIGRPDGNEAIVELLKSPTARLDADNTSYVLLKLAPAGQQDQQ
jgi:hypothetical protein